MELQVELGTEREHDAIRMMEKFKKIAKQQKILIDDLSEKEYARSRVTTLTTETQTSLTGQKMADMEMRFAHDVDHLREKLKKKSDECTKLKTMIKRYAKTEGKLRRIVERSHDIIQAQEELMGGGSTFEGSRSRLRSGSNILISEPWNTGRDNERGRKFSKT